MFRQVILTTAFAIAAGSASAQEKAAPAKPVEAPATHGFIGVKKCSMCHKGEAKGTVYEKWMESNHAKAYQTLVAKKDGSEKKAECLTCHTTGYGKGGYALDAANAAEFEGVQCEACHGGGADFKLTHNKDAAAAAAQGFVAKPDVKTCQQCHNEKSPSFDKAKPFDFEAMHKLIDHRFRDKAKAGAAK